MASILLSIVFYSFPYVFHISIFYNVFFYSISGGVPKIEIRKHENVE